LLLGCEHLTQPARDGSLDGARRGLDELTQLFQSGKYDLALDAELSRKLMYAGLTCHCTPHPEVGGQVTRTTSLVH